MAQRCLSDPGANNLSAVLHNKGFPEHLLGEDGAETLTLTVCNETVLT